MTELTAFPLEHWTWWAPVRVAVWRFVHATRPDVLGELVAHVGETVVLSGTGADWFSALERRDDYIDVVDRLTRQILDGLPPAAIDRGFVRRGELPALDPFLVRGLYTTVEASLDPPDPAGPGFDGESSPPAAR